MSKLSSVVLLVASALANPALAQTQPVQPQPDPQASLPQQDLPQNGGAGARTGNITSSGETVPNPGASESSGTTDLDRGVQRQDQKIESSICKGC